MHQSITDDNHPPSVKYDYQQHIDLSIQWTRRLLKPIGLWPSSHATPKLQKYFFQFINVAFYGLIAFRSLPMAIYIFLEIEDVYSKLKQCGPLIFGLISFAKYYSMIVHGAEIRECVERIKWDWKNITFSDDRDIMLTNANFGRKMTILCTLFTYSGFVFYNVVIPFSIGKITTEDNLTYIPLVFPFSSYIMDTRHSPVNEIVFSIQLTAAFVGHTTGVAACGLAASLAAHVCGQIQVLINWLNHLVDGRSDMDDNVDRRIARIVSQHVRILKFLTLTEQTLRQMSFAEFLGCTLDICLVGYYVIMEINDLKTAITYVSLLISLTFNIFIFCYIGEIVTENCRKIGEMSYMIEWYRLPGKKKLCCVMIIAMSNSTASLTAGKMVELTINTFANVIKTAVGFLNVLRATT
ncbi:odorant receptor 13a-like [Ceratina calcarata]|uniref:Odorant receptor n=2 Tax=Ceratina calcarata TaxID=156304 RepID=A0AAJ7IXM5_9HYME|nr:odorant receptor 13a-like [Ceratina calcarata]